MSFATWLNKVFSVVHQLKGRLFSVQHDRFNSVRKTRISRHHTIKTTHNQCLILSSAGLRGVSAIVILLEQILVH